ncbi:uncharacterized protein A4U43_C01F11400 [Asparagus officinalis]|uniref:Uncharacterized protein n=1 Tax=Asparagus officinalis TaxID=4686 RepID=A0A5P1FNJ3_ASPOF|nr:two-component response regulator-like PRR95 [Asparagus officinalis]ONK79885.1 uncharacterized protein A4U43_C01F11400 [Asparagus officinalis]
MSLELRNLEEEELVKDEDEEERSSSSSSRKRRRRSWEEKFIFNGDGGGSLRVVLVEGDDSTRHIIAALLRKCNYKVAAVSDGLKAWEIVKERPDSIDVVLAEVEVPSISGVSLLSMIMDHESCKHIPVIMMSSNDSVNIVFNCMLKGAADFLVKPVRKNELRNLWQHVWRRQTLNDGIGNKGVHQDDNAMKTFEANPRKAKQSSGSIPPMHINKEDSEKGSDAKSSCTKLDVEVESMCKQSNIEPQQRTCKDSSHIIETICQNDEWKFGRNDEEFAPPNGTCVANDQLIAEEQSCALVDTATQKQLINLISTIDNQQGCSYEPRENSAKNDNLYYTQEVVSCDEEFSCSPYSTPLLKLSLSRYDDNHVEKEEKNECRILNHSSSSAFSVYDGKIPVSNFLETGNLETQYEENYSPSTKQIPDKDPDTRNSIPMWNSTMQHLNTEDAKSSSAHSSIENGTTIKCAPIRVIPLRIPVAGVNWDRYHESMQPIFYPDSLDRQSDTRDHFAHHHNQNGTSSSLCDANVDRTDGNGNSSISTTDVPNVTSELRNQVEKKQMDLCRLSQREAALKKFRLKRKDRCFEKKVRYQSRKRLAEQRPRIKGQFVRHIKADAPSAESSTYKIEAEVR